MAPVKLFSAARILVGPNLEPMAHAAILVENGKIAAVGPRSDVQSPSGTEIIDLGDATLVPTDRRAPPYFRRGQHPASYACNRA